MIKKYFFLKVYCTEVNFFGLPTTQNDKLCIFKYRKKIYLDFIKLFIRYFSNRIH